MSVSSEQKTYATSHMATISHDEPVPLTDVQKTLSQLWRQASSAAQEEGQGALALASLWNLVTYQGTRDQEISGEGGAAAILQETLKEVTASVPARVIYLEERLGGSLPASGREVEARVSTCSLHTSAGPRMVCCEEIHLAGYGEAGRSHFPALVRALLTPDLPVALVWLEDVPRKGRMLGQLLQLSHRLLIDSQHTTDPALLPTVYELMQTTPGKIVDLGWLRLIPLRQLLADFFDPPGRAGQLSQLQGITIETSPEGRNTGLLLLGWLLSRCGYGEVRAVDMGTAKGAFRWNAGGPGKPFPIDFTVRDGYGGLDGIFHIEIQAGGDTFSLHDVDPEHMAVRGPDGESPRVALREADDAGLIVAALGRNPADRIFSEAMATASLLVETEQWNR